MKILHADFETTTQNIDTESTRVWLWGIMYQDLKLKVGVNIDSFFDEIDSYTESTTIYFHNGGRFDFEFIKHYTGLKRRWVVSTRQLAKWTINILARSVSDTYGMTYVNLKGARIYFRDSYKYLGVALAKLPGSTKIKKEKEFYERYRDYKSVEEISKEDLDYLREDIMTQKINMDQYIKIKKVTSKNYTKTSCAWKEFKTHCKYKDMYEDKVSLEEWNYFYNFAVGAYSTGNMEYKNKIVENVISIDVNSLYPKVMYDSWLPYGEPIYGCEYKCEHKCQLLEIMISAKIKDGLHPTLSTGKTSGESIEWKTTFEKEHVFTTNTYWDVVKNHYNIQEFKIVKKTCFKASWGVAHQFFDEKMEIKIKAKEDSVERLAAKIDMNGCYGRFMMSPYSDMWMPILVKNAGKIKKSETIYGKYVLRKIQEVQEKIMYNPMGIFILANARAITVDVINKFPEDWIYSDTDSAKFKNMTVERLKEAGVFIHESALGAWKYEWKARWFFWQTRKLYFGSDKENGILNGEMCATAGINFEKTFKTKVIVKDEEEYLECLNIWEVYDRKYEVKTTTAVRVNGGILIKDISKKLKS